MLDLEHLYYKHNKRYFGGLLPLDVVVEFSDKKPNSWAEGLFIPSLIQTWDYRHGPRPKVPTIRIDTKLIEFEVTAEMYLFHGMVHLRGTLGDRRFFTHGPTFQQ